jgi:hypothetical protein
MHSRESMLLGRALAAHGGTVHQLAHETLSAYGGTVTPPNVPHHLADQT